MSNLTVLSPCYFETKQPLRRLVESCQPRGLTLRTYGDGQLFSNWMNVKLHDLVPQVEACETEYVLYADGQDVIALRDERPIVELLKAAGAVVVAGERHCYPDDSMFEAFPECSTDYRWPNAGLFGGRKETLLECLRTMKEKYAEGGNDQLAWCKAIAARAIPAVIDYYANLFQTMDGETLNVSMVIDPNVGMVQNASTGAYPCFVHFNGGDKENRMREFEQWIG